MSWAQRTSGARPGRWISWLRRSAPVVRLRRGRLTGWLLRSRLARRFSRYTVGAAVGAVVAELAFLVVYAADDHVGPAVASVVAFFAGAVPKYFVNRQWVWAGRDRSRPVGQLLRYAAVVVVSIGVSAATTRAADAYAATLTHDPRLRVAFVGGVYAATFVVLFVAKFVVFDRLVFVDRSGGGSASEGRGGPGSAPAGPTGGARPAPGVDEAPAGRDDARASRNEDAPSGTGASVRAAARALTRR